MWFLIGVLILIFFIVFSYFFVKRKFENYFGSSLKDILKQARIDDEEIPKSLSSMDSIYLEQVKKDFPDININEIKRLAETEILNIFKAIERKNNSLVKGKMRSIVDSKIEDNKEKQVSYDNIKFHNTVLSKYENKDGIATITIGSSFEYIFKKDDKTKKVQDRAKVEFIYIIDSNEVEINKKVLGINCPNCGAPVTSLGRKTCKYCGTSVVDIVKRVWTINDVKFY